MGLSQEELSGQLNVSRQTISKWENGTAYPDMLNLMTISGFFGISIDDLVNGEEQAKDTPDIIEDKPVAETDTRSRGHYEYKSRICIRDLPLIHVNCGVGAYKAKGIIAVGNISTGVLSAGLIARGFITAGVLSMGFFSMGVLSAAVIAIGCISAGLLSIGGIALGVLTLGGVAIGVVSIGGCSLACSVAVGGYSYAPVSVGYIAKGGSTLAIENAGGIINVTAEDVRALIAQRYPDYPKILADWATLLFS